MKNAFFFPAFFLLCFLNASAQQSFVRNKNIIFTYMNLTNGPVVADSLIIDVPVEGYVLLEFTGYCTAKAGDRIYFAAGETPTTGFNNDVVAGEAPNFDQDHINFSQTHLVDVSAGTHDFFAVAERFGETDGNGIIHLYATFSASFFPKNVPAEPRVMQYGISSTDVNVAGGAKELGKIVFNAPGPGKAMVRFDGMCISNPGDRLALSVTDDPDAATPANAALVEAIDEDVNYSPFSHTRTFDVAEGFTTFRAMVAPTDELEGGAIASVFANLTLVFFPENGFVETFNHQVNAPDTQLDGPVTVFAQQTIDAPVPGRVLLRFDGVCSSTPGDRIVLASSHFEGWIPNDGCTALEAFDEDINNGNFNHIRVFDVDAGEHTFYAVGQNWVENDGTGAASVYGNFTVQFFPSEAVVSSVETLVTTPQFAIAPNPVTDVLRLQFDPESATAEARIDVLDLSGKVLVSGTKYAGATTAEVPVGHLETGLHVVRLSKNNTVSVKKFVKTAP